MLLFPFKSLSNLDHHPLDRQQLNVDSGHGGLTTRRSISRLTSSTPSKAQIISVMAPALSFPITGPANHWNFSPIHRPLAMWLPAPMALAFSQQ